MDRIKLLVAQLVAIAANLEAELARTVVGELPPQPIDPGLPVQPGAASAAALQTMMPLQPQGQPLFGAMEGVVDVGAVAHEELAPELPQPVPGAQLRKLYRVVYGTGALLPGIPLASCCAPNPQMAEALKTGIELARPGWRGLLRVVEVAV